MYKRLLLIVLIIFAYFVLIEEKPAEVGDIENQAIIKTICDIYSIQHINYNLDTIRIISNSIYNVCNEYDLSYDWFISMIYTESRFIYNARGKTGDIGLCQITKYALDEYNKYHNTKYILEDMYSIELNIEVGGWYLKQKLKESNNHYNIALAKYNAGKYNEIGEQYYITVKKHKDMINNKRK